MKYLFPFLLLLLFALPSQLSAQAEMVGDWKTMVPNQDGQMMPLVVSIKSDNSYTVDFGADGQVEITGTYEAKDGLMHIQDGEGSDCTGKGVYKCEVNDEGMTMTRVSDECENRGGPEGKMAFTRA